MIDPDSTARRTFLLRALTHASLFAAVPGLAACSGGSAGGAPRALKSNLAHVGALLEQDANGLRLPAGFTSRVVAVAGARMNLFSSVDR